MSLSSAVAKLALKGKGTNLQLRMSTFQEVVRAVSVSADLRNAALAASNRSYSPYSHSPCGVAFETNPEGVGPRIYSGFYIENAAFNPSFPPLQFALAGLVRDGGSYANIKQLVLVEKLNPVISHIENTRVLLHSIAPEAKMAVLYVDDENEQEH